MSDQTWTPELASQEVEEGMDRIDLPESDRDDVRRFSEFLRIQKQRAAGNTSTLSAEMRNWLLGKEPTPSHNHQGADP